MIPALLLTAFPAPGDRVPPLEFVSADGAPVRWTPGRRTVMTFCAFWCDTWRTQLPRVAQASRMLRGQPVEFLTISVDGRWADVPTREVAGRALLDRGGSVTRRLGVDRVPSTLVVEPDGTISFASSGTLRTSDLVARLTGPPREGGYVYLTFDDFPPRQGGEDLLDSLRAARVPATFFCIGLNARSRPALVRRAVREGHGVEVHAWDHSAPDPEVARTAAYLRSLGASPRWSRTPGSETVRSLGGTVRPAPVADPYDYRRPGASEIARRVSLAVRPGSVVQLHAGVSDTVEALPALVRSLRARGYRFRRLEPVASVSDR